MVLVMMAVKLYKIRMAVEASAVTEVVIVTSVQHYYLSYCV